MKVSFYKMNGGGLCPASDLEKDKMDKFKNGEIYEIDIKYERNSSFHRKVFSFFNFVFQYWRNGNEYDEEQAQFDRFRKDLTILAGYNHKVYNYKGELRLEAKSLSYSSMEQDEFEQFYTALINATSKHVMKDANDVEISKLMNFF